MLRLPRCLSMLLFSIPAAGLPTAAAPAQVVHTPEGVVEFIGLRSWTVDMIRDSMRIHAPLQGLGQCAGVLRGLGFPAASALRVSGDTTLVLVVEPAHAARIRRLSPSGVAAPFRWLPARRLFLADGGRPWRRAVQFGDLWERSDSATRAHVMQAVGDTATFLQVLEFLGSLNDSAELEAAAHVLDHDDNPEHRMMAAGILSRFPPEPEAWYAVLRALADADEGVAAAADQSLGFILRYPPKTLDLHPVRSELRTLVAGAFAGAAPRVLEVLHRFGSPSDGRYVLAHNHHLVLAMLEASRKEYRKVAHDVLVLAAGGRDRGRRARDWLAWLSRLASPDV